MTDSRRPSRATGSKSADNALQLANVLRREGSITVSDAARRLGVSPPSAHRALRALQHRQFAAQSGDRRYHAGPALLPDATEQAFSASLRGVALSHLAHLSLAAMRAVHLVIRSGVFLRVLASRESDSAQNEDREGALFPLQSTAVGLMVLAEMSDAELADVLPDLPGPAPDRAALTAALESARALGYAVQDDAAGDTQIGVPLRWYGQVLAGVELTLREEDFAPDDVPGYVAGLRRCAALIEQDMGRGFQPDPEALRG